jgi:hypothetical protein
LEFRELTFIVAPRVIFISVLTTYSNLGEQAFAADCPVLMDTANEVVYEFKLFLH